MNNYFTQWNNLPWKPTNKSLTRQVNNDKFNILNNVLFLNSIPSVRKPVLTKPTKTDYMSTESVLNKITKEIPLVFFVRIFLQVHKGESLKWL